MTHPPQYEIGKLYHPDKTYYEQGLDFNYRKIEGSDQGMLELRVFFEDIQDYEVQMVTKGRLTFAIIATNDIIVFLSQFGHTQPWNDSTFNINLVAPEERVIPPEHITPDDTRLFIILIEASTGIIKGMRLVRLGMNFCEYLFLAMREQYNHTFYKDVYLDQVDMLYTAFPRPHQLLQHVQRSCIIESNINN